MSESGAAEVLDRGIMGDHTYTTLEAFAVAGARHQMTVCGTAERPLQLSHEHTHP